MKIIISFLLLSLLSTIYVITGDATSERTKKDCINYYTTCYVDSYTDTDVENARLYLINQFSNLTHPTTTPCAKLRVRKNIKCLNDEEKQIFRETLLAVFSNQTFISYLTQTHTEYWIEEHKFPEGLYWHFKFMLEFEKRMISINPRAALHYHDNIIEWQDAYNSIVWDMLGKASTNDPNYPCVNGNGWQDIKVTYDGTASPPTISPRCIKREMPKNMTWEPPEWTTAFLQMGLRAEIINAYLKVILELLISSGQVEYQSFITLLFDFLCNYVLDLDLYDLLVLFNSILNAYVKDTDDINFFGQFFALAAFTSHFKRHLDTGGPTGDLSTPNAPNDPDFWCFHAFDDLMTRLYQFQDITLNEFSYNIGPHLNHADHKIYANNIYSDHLNFYTNTKVKELMEIGWGDMCYIYDHLVVAIRDRNNPKLPEMYWRIKDCLGTTNITMYKYYFPHFYRNDLPKDHKDYKPLTSFSMYLPEVGNCNSNATGTPCKQFIAASRYSDNANNRRQYDVFKNNAPGTTAHPIPTDIDLTSLTDVAEEMYMKFIQVLNENNCCTVYSYP